MTPDTFASLVQALQVTVVTSLIFIGGLSSCLSLWVMPLTALLPPKLLAKQFKQTFTWGAQILMPSSRVLGASLLLTTVLTSRLSDPVEAENWKTWAALFLTLITVAPYEIYFIFPINDRVEEISDELEKGAKQEEDVKRELHELLGKWQFKNFGRVALPALVGVGGMMNIVRI